jgi:hypothetical protein
LRFGEALPSAYGEGESLFWFHLPCAACMRPEKVLAALEAGAAGDDVPERDWLNWASAILERSQQPCGAEGDAAWGGPRGIHFRGRGGACRPADKAKSDDRRIATVDLERAARAGIEHPRLTELVRVERAASGRARCRSCHELVEKDRLRLALQTFSDGRFTASGTIHVECAEAYFGTAELRARLEHLQDLDPSLVPELERALADQRPIPKGDPAASELSPERAGLA